MKLIRTGVLLCILLPRLGLGQAAATAPVPPITPAVAEAEAHDHLLRRVDPVYPDAAEAAHIAGTVVLRVTVDQGGRVAHIVPVGGPELLVPSASEAVRQWRYTPFTVNNTVAEVHTTVRVPFGELAAKAEEQRLLAVYRPLWKDCMAAVDGRAEAAKQSEACHLAAAQAAQFAPNTRPVERRQSDEYYAIALARSSDFAQTAIWAAKALALFQEDPADPAGADTAALVLAQASAATGNVTEAAQSLSEAEKGLRKALSSAPNPDLKHRYADALKKSLEFHAGLLTLMMKPSDAQAKLHEADAL